MMVSKNRRMFELRLGQLGLVLFIGGISLLLFGLFLLGVMVGKELETYPDQYARGIPDLLRERFFPSPVKGDRAVQAWPKGEDEFAKEGDSFDLTFFDTLAGKGGGKDESPTVKPETAPKAVPPGGGPPATIQTDIRIPATPMGGEGLGGSEALPRKAEAPTGKVAAPSRETFEVQAAAYREKDSANQLVKRLARFGFSAQVVMRDIPERGRWYRVIAGGFDNREKAEGAAEQMAAKIRGLKCVVRAAEKGN